MTALPTRFAAVTIALLGLAVPPAWAESPGGAQIPAGAHEKGVGVVTTLSGVATVARLPAPRPLPLHFKDDVFLRDQISTAEKSTVRVLLGGKALLTMRELSRLTITEEAGRSTVDLASGKVAVGVARQRMLPGESIEIRTATAVAAVRGTVLIVEIVDAPQPTTNVHVLHGLVTVTSPADPAAPPVEVGSLQSLHSTGAGPGTLRTLTQGEAEALFADLRSEPQIGQEPGDFLDDLGRQEQARAAWLALIIDRARGGGAAPPLACAGPGCGTAGAGTADITPCSVGGCGDPDPPAAAGGGPGGPVKSGKALTTYNGKIVNVGGDFYTVPNGASPTLTQPLLETTATTLTVGGVLVSAQGTLAAADSGHPFIFLDPSTLTAANILRINGNGSVTAATTFFQDLKGTLTLTGEAVSVTGNSVLTGTGAGGFLALDGSVAAVTASVLSANGAKTTVTLAGPLLEASGGAVVTARGLASVNAALLDASAPLLGLTGGSAFTSAADAVSLAAVNGATQFASLAQLDASVFTVKAGAALNVAGNSTVSVGADLFTLANKSSLVLLSGPLVSVAGNSTLTITGALLNFVGTGNTVSVTNNLCPGACAIVAGIPVFVAGGGALSLTNPIKNAAGNTIKYSSPSAALVSLAGAASTLTVLGK